MAQLDPGPRLPADQRRQNVKLGLILASVALVFFVGFVLKAAVFGL